MYNPEIQTLADVPRHHARVRPDAAAMTFGERITTYAEWNKRCSQVANGLAAFGIRPGARVASSIRIRIATSKFCLVRRRSAPFLFR